jgi:hypothetical protein
MEMEELRQIKDVRSLIEEFCENCRLRGMTEEGIRRYKSSPLDSMVRVSLPGIKLTGLHNTVKTFTKFCYTFKALTQFDPRARQSSHFCKNLEIDEGYFRT